MCFFLSTRHHSSKARDPVGVHGSRIGKCASTDHAGCHTGDLQRLRFFGSIDEVMLRQTHNDRKRRK